jgi:serine/threonine protein kinase
VIGEGSHAVVFLAQRHGNDQAFPVVLKLLRPRAVRRSAALVAHTISKEVEALKRLTAREPKPEFVVQFLDTGILTLGSEALPLPWVVVEYVPGGDEGVTLRARVLSSLVRSGHAFEPLRARNALRCVIAGVAAVHEVGVIHRDVTPDNILACESPRGEIFKLADFGIARVSTASTFGDVLLGTPGYCAPEQSFPEKVGVGAYSDVFGIACTAFFALTGEPYFHAPTVAETLVEVYAATRSSLQAARGLAPLLRTDDARCRSIDRVLSHATCPHPADRPQSASEFGELLLPLLVPF